MLYSSQPLSLSSAEALPALEESANASELPIRVPAGLPDQQRNALTPPTVYKLCDALEQLRLQDVKRFQHKSKDDAEARLLEEATKGVMVRFLGLVTSKLEAARQRGESEQLLELLTQVFCLDG